MLLESNDWVFVLQIGVITKIVQQKEVNLLALLRMRLLAAIYTRNIKINSVVATNLVKSLQALLVCVKCFVKKCINSILFVKL